MTYYADIGDYLYIIIFVVLMLLGSLEKIMKAKRQKNNPPPTTPHPYDDDFEDVDNVDNEQIPAPQSIEEMMKRMLQTMETREVEQEVVNPYQEYAEKYLNRPEETYLELPVIKETSTDKEETTNVFPTFEFDIRQAVIASEILNRKY